MIALLFFLMPAAGLADSPSNAEITAGVESHLYHAGIFKHGQVNVQVRNGIATLTGTVNSYGEKLHAVRAARHQHGVREVTDDITVNPSGVTPQQILEKARYNVLTYPFYTIFDHITLRAQGNDLIVGGQVTLPFKKSDLGKILANIKGVTYLQNKIKVLPTSDFDDQIREEIAEQVYGDPMFVNYANQVNPPIHIVVDNGQVTLYGAVNSKLERQEADIDARFATTYFGLKNNLRVVS
ncbi:MAG: BON domain-containing protein [Acidobacteriota bacterium]